MKLSNTFYNVMKYIVMIALPAIATFYATIAGIWDLPYTEAIVGTISAVDALLGALLCISSYNYNKQIEEKKEE